MQNKNRRSRLLALSLVGLTVLALGTACSANAPAPATAVTTGATVVVPFTPNAPDLQFPTLLPTVTAPAVASQPTAIVIVVTATPTETPTVQAVTRAPTKPPEPTTPAETATPFPDGVPKVYVTSLRVEPATPKADQGGTFFVTFQNVSGQDDGYNWAVEVWDTENDKRPFGLTTPQNSPMPQGVTNLTTTGWTVKGLGECHAYRARVVSRDDEDNRATFIQPDGSILWLDFTVCP